MSTSHRKRLAGIYRFDQLVAYLRDEMSWPIESDDFEELTYEYTPEELGIEASHAARIKSIQRLRPLSTNQPWGIFFVMFEKKQLPVMALRRILGQVAMKKRASSNPADKLVWKADDLLFISNYGEGEERHISFAHFSQPDNSRELPTLKVLGWDNRDTPLHLDAVAQELTGHLAWPVDDTNTVQWREQWRSAFQLRHREVITTSKDLANRLAELARDIRDRIRTALAIETDKGPLTRLLEAFRQSLVHDLNAERFADMYAQTITYGLLSARITDPRKGTVDDFAAHMRTNPFLRELMETFLKIGGRKGKAGGPGIDFDELGVSDVVELLDDTNMDAVVRDFGDRNPLEDPVIHFFEGFLAAYDKKIKKERGVFYTPRPVVSFIVRSVDELLRTEFGLEDGLADTTTWGELAKRNKELSIPEGTSPEQSFVQILDPATGTGTFLVEVIDLVNKTLLAKWTKQGHGEKKIDRLWNDYVPKHLLPRLHGYELMMAPYAIAHMKIGLKLHETGYRFESEVRARVYLTNALEPAHDFSGKLAFAIPALAHEAEAVNAVKRDNRFTVVIGNPPYSNFGQLNKGPFIQNLLTDYKKGLQEKKANLDDDCIKFIRLAHSMISISNAGIIGLITNNAYYDGLVHRIMRKVLVEDFSVRIVNLHGSKRRHDHVRHLSDDENVFDIQQGVGVSIFTKAGVIRDSECGYHQMLGSRKDKYEELSIVSAATINFEEIEPSKPYFFLVPKRGKEFSEYKMFLSVKEMFALSSNGVKTERDRISIHFSKNDVADTVSDFRNLDETDIREKYNLPRDSRDWSISRAKKDVLQNTSEDCYKMIMYRPFDFRYTWYSGRSKGFIGTPGFSIMKQMIEIDNIGLIMCRQFASKQYFTAFCTDCLAEISSQPYAPYSIFPMYRISDNKENMMQLSESDIEPNLTSKAVNVVKESMRIDFDPLGGRASGSCFSTRELTSYIYAILYSNVYRHRYLEYLSIDFPRIPITYDISLFKTLAQLGEQLVGLHLMKSPLLDRVSTVFCGKVPALVEKVSWSNNTVSLSADSQTGFKGIPENVWSFRFGSYQVCEKWLKDRQAKGGKNPRPGRILSDEDIAHYQKIIVAISETIRIMAEIDEVIEQHGGWPGAFQTNAAEENPGKARKAAEPKSDYGQTAGKK